jgi:hypothetical protein
MAKPRKFSPEVEKEIADKVAAGYSHYELMKEYETCRPVIARIVRESGVAKGKKPSQTGRSITEFAKRAKSILWRQETGKNHPSFDKWKARVEELEAGSGYTHAQCVVQASKDFPCLNRLFREYDMKAYDPHPESHPEIRQFETADTAFNGIFCEGIQQSYRDSLRWAIDAAGAYLRTGKQPVKCPCDAAFYLYKQACEEPKDFMGKLGQIEVRGIGESEEDKNFKASSNKSIAELDGMLAELMWEEEENEVDEEIEDYIQQETPPEEETEDS